jgi:TPR repeat protein
MAILSTNSDMQPKDPSVLMDQATELQYKNYSVAKLLCEQVLRLQPTHTGAMVFLGKMHQLDTGLWEKSEEASVLFRKAVDRDSSEGMVQLAELCFSQASIDDFEKIQLESRLGDLNMRLEFIRERLLDSSRNPSCVQPDLFLPKSPKVDTCVLDHQILLEVDPHNTQKIDDSVHMDDRLGLKRDSMIELEKLVPVIESMIEEFTLLQECYGSRADLLKSEAIAMLQRAECLGNLDGKAISIREKDCSQVSSFTDTYEALSVIARKGNPLAMRILADRFLDELLPERDFEKGKMWLIRAAELNDGLAVLKLAQHYEKGDCGFEENMHTAFKLYGQATFDLGRRATPNLYTMYRDGEGAPKDQREARRLDLLTQKTRISDVVSWLPTKK